MLRRGIGVADTATLPIISGKLPWKTTALTWQTVPLRNYQVQFKDNLTDAQWQDLPATISFIGNEGSVTVPADQPNRFYQVVENQ